MVDIYDDVQTLAYLHIGKLDGRNTHAMTRRVLRRAHAYSIQHITAGDWVVLRRMADGSTRVVPPKEQRLAIAEHAHASSGHFGARRTTHLLLITHWWPGILRMALDVKMLIMRPRTGYL